MSRVRFYQRDNRALKIEHLRLFHDGGRYHIETSPLICRANQWTGFNMITASVMKELRRCQTSTILKVVNYFEKKAPS